MEGAKMHRVKIQEILPSDTCSAPKSTKFMSGVVRINSTCPYCGTLTHWMRDEKGEYTSITTCRHVVGFHETRDWPVYRKAVKKSPQKKKRSSHIETIFDEPTPVERKTDVAVQKED